MLLLIIFLGVVISYTLITYFNRKREQRKENARERREEQFLNLLDSLKKNNSKQDK